MSKTFAVLGTVSLLAIGWFGRELLQAHPPAVATSQRKESARPSVSIEVVRSEAFNPVREYIGHVEPIQEADILPQVEGYVKKVCFTEGSFVREGDVLFEIDAEQYAAARRLRLSEVKSAEAKVSVARAEVDRVERYYGRLKAADDRSVTALERDTAETSLSSACAALVAAGSAVEQAKAAAAIADFNLKHTVVKSPISGRIGKALRHVGDYVSPSKGVMGHIVQTNPIRVAFPITDKDSASWKDSKGVRRLRLRLPDGCLYDHAGELDFEDNVIDRSTATVRFYARFANDAGMLLPGAIVRILCDAVNPTLRLTVPADALERAASGSYVWILHDDGSVRQTEVEAGETWENRTVVRHGLTEGARVVIAGGFKLRDGMKVDVVE